MKLMVVTNSLGHGDPRLRLRACSFRYCTNTEQKESFPHELEVI